MLPRCVQRFDVIGEKFLGEELNKALEHLQRFCILSLAKHGVCPISNQYREEKKMLPPMVWQN